MPKLPSQTYDHVWIPAGEPSAQSRFVTSDQCLGCHSAGGTGLQFHMTEPSPDADRKLANIPPCGTWRKSPMGMSGRDPIFFAQLASEIETFHPEASTLIQDTCMSCPAVQGHRQHVIDRYAETKTCGPPERAALDAVPCPAGNPTESLAHYAALGRDGVSCTTCHGMVVGKEASEKGRMLARRRAPEGRQSGLERSCQDLHWELHDGRSRRNLRPLQDPKKKPMEQATGLVACS